jgi:hypothetical protein
VSSSDEVTACITREVSRAFQRLAGTRLVVVGGRSRYPQQKFGELPGRGRGVQHGRHHLSIRVPDHRRTEQNGVTDGGERVYQQFRTLRVRICHDVSPYGHDRFVPDRRDSRSIRATRQAHPTRTRADDHRLDHDDDPRPGPATPPQMRHIGLVPRVYRADHTAHIRERLKRQALYFTTGELVAVIGAITIAVLLSLQDLAPHALTRLAWGVVILLASIAGLGLTITGVQYLIYRRRRADLDAEGAQVIGEWHARPRKPQPRD